MSEFWEGLSISIFCFLLSFAFPFPGLSLPLCFFPVLHFHLSFHIFSRAFAVLTWPIAICAFKWSESCCWRLETLESKVIWMVEPFFAGMLVAYGIWLPTKSETFRNFVVKRRDWTLSLVWSRSTAVAVWATTANQRTHARSRAHTHTYTYTYAYTYTIRILHVYVHIHTRFGYIG